MAFIPVSSRLVRHGIFQNVLGHDSIIQGLRELARGECDLGLQHDTFRQPLVAYITMPHNADTVGS
eukprot:4683119-Amphidinium_carterae.1